MEGMYKSDPGYVENSMQHLERPPSPTQIYPLPRPNEGINSSILDPKIDNSLERGNFTPFPFDPVDNVLDRSQNSLGALGSIMHRRLSHSPEEKHLRQRRRKSSKETSMDHSKHSTPGKSPKSPMVTDIDQAMAQRDEKKLKSILVESNPAGNTSLAACSKSPSTHYQTDSDVEETNIDEEPPSAKMIASLKQKSIDAELADSLITTPNSISTGPRRRCLLNKDYHGASVSFDEAIKWPPALPAELDKSKSENFDGATLMNWLCSEFNESHHLYSILSRHDYRIIVSQFCTHLLSAGILSEAEKKHRENIFKTHNQYKWSGHDTCQDTPGLESAQAASYQRPVASSLSHDGGVVEWNHRPRYSESGYRSSPSRDVFFLNDCSPDPVLVDSLLAAPPNTPLSTPFMSKDTSPSGYLSDCLQFEYLKKPDNISNQAFSPMIEKTHCSIPTKTEKIQRNISTNIETVYSGRPQEHSCVFDAKINDIEQALSSTKIKIDELEKSDVPTFEKSDVPILEKSDVTTIEKSDVTVLKKNDVTTLEKSDVSTLEKSDFSTLEKSDVPTLEKNDVTILEKSDVTTIEKNDVTAFEKSDVTTLEKSDVSTLEKIDVTTLEKSDVSTLEKSDVLAYNSSSVLEMGASKVESISCREPSVHWSSTVPSQVLPPATSSPVLASRSNTSFVRPSSDLMLSTPTLQADPLLLRFEHVDEKRDSEAQLKKEFEEQKESLKKGHEEEIARMREGYISQIERLSDQIIALQGELNKMKTLAGIDKLTQEALHAADAASREAGYRQHNGSTESKEMMIAVTGTPTHLKSLKDDSLLETQDSCRFEAPPPIPPSPPTMTYSKPPVPPPPPPPPPHAIGGPPPPPPPPPPGFAGPPPPPPPPPGGVGPPPPPPPPGGPGLAQRKESSKPIINPKSPMKPLFWKRIQVPTAKSSKDVSSGSSAHQLFWEEIEEENINFEFFEELFAKVPVEPKKKAATNTKKPKAVQAAKVVPPKRSQAVGILLSSIRMEFSEIEEAILNLDTSNLDVEKFKAIYDNRPDEEEIKMIKQQLEKHPDVPLDKPEQFLYDLEQIPYVSDRIFCFIFQSSFQESMTQIDSKLNNLKMTCQSLSTFVGVRRIFGLILACGNYMNGGSRTRGQADGFDLEILSKLKDVKGKDNRTSLLQFVVSRYVQKYDVDVMGTDKAKLPLPDPSDILQAGLVNFEDTEKELRRIRKDFESAESKANNILSSLTSDHIEPFKSVMTAFFQKGKQDLSEQEDNLHECMKLFDQTCTFFCVKPRGNEKVVTPEHFFSLWLSFCSDFKDMWKKEQQHIMKLRIKEAEETVRMIKESKSVLPPTRAKKIGGLKDRLSRQGKI